MISLSRKLILGSTSPRRKQILNQLGIPFCVRPPRFKEVIPVKNVYRPGCLAEQWARAKAETVHFKKNEIVLTMDTIVFLRGKVIGKPGDADAAAKILALLSGKRHWVYSGVAVKDKDRRIKSAWCRTGVFLKKLSKKEIVSYVRTGEPLDKAGAYGIQGKAAAFVEKINGCYFNVVGFPVHLTMTMLKAYII